MQRAPGWLTTRRHDHIELLIRHVVDGRICRLLPVLGIHEPEPFVSLRVEA